MKLRIDMSAAVVTRRLRQVEELRRLCLALANSSEGRRIRAKHGANTIVKRTSDALGRRAGCSRRCT